MRHSIWTLLAAGFVLATGTDAFAQECKPDFEKNGLLCYPNCKEGFKGVGPVCWASCPAGYKDDGATCRKDVHITAKSSYGRGAGYPLWDEGKCKSQNSQGCEKNGLLWYPNCRAGFKGVGPVCWGTCPAGYKDDGATCRKDAHIFGKSSYGRGVGEPLHVLPSPLGKRGHALLVCIENMHDRPVTDAFLESLGVALSWPYAMKYEKYLMIKNCRPKDLRWGLTYGKNNNLTMDVATLVHGSPESMALTADNGNGYSTVTSADIRGLRSIGARIRAVFQLNCYGASLNDDWVAAGAQAVTGARLINTRVVGFTSFFGAWTSGKSFKQSVDAVNADKGLAASIYAKAKGVFDSIGDSCCKVCTTDDCKKKQASCKSGMNVFGKDAHDKFCSYYRAVTNGADSTFMCAGNDRIRF